MKKQPIIGINSNASNTATINALGGGGRREEEGEGGVPDQTEGYPPSTPTTLRTNVSEKNAEQLINELQGRDMLKCITPITSNVQLILLEVFEVLLPVRELIMRLVLSDTAFLPSCCAGQCWASTNY